MYRVKSMYYLYHISKKEDVDDLSSGYIGITNNTKNRFRQHMSAMRTGVKGRLYNAMRRYEQELVFTVISNGSYEEILKQEEQLRPESNLAWNTDCGGTSNRSCEVRAKIKVGQYDREVPQCQRDAVAKANSRRKGEKKSEADRAKVSGKNSYMYQGEITTPAGSYSSLQDAAVAEGVSKQTIKNRIDSDREKWSGYSKRKKSKKRVITTPNGIFSTVSEAASANGVSRSSVSKRVKDPDRNDWSEVVTYE